MTTADRGSHDPNASHNCDEPSDNGSLICGMTGAAAAQLRRYPASLQLCRPDLSGRPRDREGQAAAGAGPKACVKGLAVEARTTR